eukprot:Nk52_evm51s2579 gene=Nk52_evmTU51s2579
MSGMEQDPLNNISYPIPIGIDHNIITSKRSHSKSHAFDFRNGVSVFEPTKPGLGGERLLGQKPPTKSSTMAYQSAEGNPGVPAWVAYDRQVLRFYAYFQEAVHEKREEQYRVRKCSIYYYLEDDTIQVIEGRITNSGIPQGTLIRRHRIPKEGGKSRKCSGGSDDSGTVADYLDDEDKSEFFTIDDFNIDKEFVFYGRCYKITDCDEFTRNFLTKLGCKLNDPVATPGDPYTTHRNQMIASMKPRRPYERTDTLAQFLENDRKVLRFFCCWDDTDSVFGDRRDMVLHYFLADDTIEIREIIPHNSGRDCAPTFLKRDRLPTSFNAVKGPGQDLGEYYTDRNLVIGGVINVYGRHIILCDMDDFTRNYYNSKYGLTNFEPIDTAGRAPEPRVIEFPEYNGFGSEQDSLGSCISLIPKPPKKDFKKLMEMDNMVLRFSARFDTNKPIDADRRFIIYFYLADDQVLVYEPPLRNSGIIGGKFMEKMRCKNPDRGDEYYSASDFYVGGRVTFQKHHFIILEGDEYALKYMEQNPDMFPVANPQRIAQLIQKAAQGDAGGESGNCLAKMFKDSDPEDSESVKIQDFEAILKSFGLNKHEILTMVRFYRKDCDDKGAFRYKNVLSELGLLE